MKQINFLSKIDQSMQPALILPAVGKSPCPLAVCLHTWSYGLEHLDESLPQQCDERSWHFIYPLFRGPNWNPEACGSDFVVSDIVCAVEYMKENYNVDESRIYLIGGSGGGMVSLLMAGRRPEIWSAVSAWCPVSDIATWYVQLIEKKVNSGERRYADHILAVCGGNPITCPEASKQAKYRSPLTWLKGAKGKVILDIQAGIHDGHWGSVPVSHSILAFNEVADPEDRISSEDIKYIVEKEEIPVHLQFHGQDVAYGSFKVLLRRISGKVRLSIFEGGHDILVGPAFGFFDYQIKGKEPVWYSGERIPVKATELTK